MAKLNDMPNVVSSVNSFYPFMDNYAQVFYGTDLNSSTGLSESWILNETWHFLFSLNGFRFQPNFNNGNLTCEVPLEEIEVGTIFKYGVGRTKLNT